jgi:hypothetical protein
VSTCLVSLSVVVFIGHGEFNSCLVHDVREFFDFFLGSLHCRMTRPPSSPTRPFTAENTPCGSAPKAN